MTDEDWVKAAMTDDSVAAELLVRLHHAPPSKRDSSPSLPLEWTVRQRRSRPLLHPKKKPTPTTSPTTPLSWSGHTSVSGGGGSADGFEESSRPSPKRPEPTRSKVSATSGTTTIKRSRKKKTLAELKEDEMLLIKERRHLKRELANLRVTLEKERTKNESLKRLKLDLESRPVPERVTATLPVEAASDQMQPKAASSCDPVPPIIPCVRIDKPSAAKPPPALNGPSELHQEVTDQENEKFVLPDLNLPLEEVSNPEVLCRAS